MKRIYAVVCCLSCILISSAFIYTQKKKSKTTEQNVAKGAVSDVVGYVSLDSPEKKEAAVVALVEKTVSMLEKTDRDKAFHDMTWSQTFKEGELYTFAHGVDGIIWAQGDEHKDLLWKNVDTLQDDLGAYFIQGLREAAQQAEGKGAWYSYQWNRATKKTYVRLVQKDGHDYVIGAGYYPTSKKDYVISFVKRAVMEFNSSLEKGIDKDTIFGLFTYPESDFLYGDLYLYVLNEEGIEVADGGMPGDIGVNLTDIPDAQGNYYVQSIIDGLLDRPTGEGVWVSYSLKGAKKVAYAERVVDKQGNSFFIVAGYWPSSTRETVMKLVNKGVSYLKEHSTKEAAKDFAYAGIRYEQSKYMQGDVYLVVFDDEGICHAHGERPELIGSSILSMQDAGGNYIIKTILAGMKDETASWFEFERKNSFWSVYVKKLVKDSGKTLYVMGGFYPVSKANAAGLLVKSAASYLRKNEEKTAFDAFASDSGDFIRGDLQVTVFDFDGYCYVDGLNRKQIWKNIFSSEDKADAVFKVIAKKAQAVTFDDVFMAQGTQHGVSCVYLCQKVKKSGMIYIVCTSFCP